MTKKLEVIIREERLAAVKDALRNIGIVGMNIVEVRGHGRDGGITLVGRSGTYRVDMLPRVQLNIVLSDRNVDKTVETIKQATSNGSHGEGIIFIYPVDDVIRIPSGEHGSEALMYESDIDARRIAEVAELSA